MISGPVISLLAGHRGIGNGKIGLSYFMKTYSWKIYFRKLTLKHAPVFSEETIIEITSSPEKNDRQKDARGDTM